MAKVSAAALVVLRAATATDDRITLPPGQLDRGLYEEVNEVLVRLRGKWKGGKTAAHLFPYDPRPLLAAVLATGDEPPKNPTAFFPTPAALVTMMLDEAGLHEQSMLRVLEPSGGVGGIADGLLATSPRVTLDVVELLPLNAALLRAKGYTVHEQDFLTYTTGDYDVVLMNPPFALEGDANAYITHIRHAFSLLREGGRLVAIAPTSFKYRTQKAYQEFRDWVATYGEWSALPDGAFKESGTGVQTVLISMLKQVAPWKAEPRQGYHCGHCYHTSLSADSDYATNAAAYKLVNAHATREHIAAFYREFLRKSDLPFTLSVGCIDELHGQLLEPAA